MKNIKDQQLIYHLTALDNIPSILQNGLLPRSKLRQFQDIADCEIIQLRKRLSLQDYIPFHFFARNPFDGVVQKNYRNKQFVIIAVKRTLAKIKNWKIIPQHPLANESIDLFDYNEGMQVIDWETMNRRDYRDPYCKNVCMAECLSPMTVTPQMFSVIFIADSKAMATINKLLISSRLNIKIIINAAMFVR